METSTLPHWKAGDVIVLRGVWHHKIRFAGAVIIVQDTSQLIAMYWQAGTPNRIPAKRPAPRDLLSNELDIIPSQWTDTDVLMLVTPCASHAIYVMWETGQKKLRCWYVDLQEPLRRTSLGFDTMDQLLDVVIYPDQSAWQWKDEDEFEEAIAIGVYSAEEAQAIRAEGEKVIRQFLAGQSPFCDGWENWSPPAEWDIPDMPEGWDNLS
jgi:hypothetical protein